VKKKKKRQKISVQRDGSRGHKPVLLTDTRASRSVKGTIWRPKRTIVENRPAGATNCDRGGSNKVRREKTDVVHAGRLGRETNHNGDAVRGSRNTRTEKKAV